MHSFVRNNNEYYDNNFFEYKPLHLHAGSLPHSYILSEALRHLPLDPSLVSFFSSVQKKQGVNRTLWGVRFEKNRFSTELYFFYPKKFPQNNFERVKELVNPLLKKKFSNEKVPPGGYIFTFNPNGARTEGINIGYADVKKHKAVMHIDDTGFFFNVKDPVFYSYLLRPGSKKPEKRNTYYTFFGLNQLFEILEKTYELCREMFPGQDPLLSNQYLSFPYLFQNNTMVHTSAVTRKTDAIGFYFYSLRFDNFILFLRFHKYPEKFIRALLRKKNQLWHLRYDVGIDFYLEKGKFKIKKTAFWGTL